VQGAGHRAHGTGCRAQGAGHRAQGSEHILQIQYCNILNINKKTADKKVGSNKMKTQLF